MQEAVKWQIDHLGPGGWERGHVVVANHPQAGGSHLPDITVMSPYFPDGATAPAFYVASRGHHAGMLFVSLKKGAFSCARLVAPWGSLGLEC